jgi:hypothetical protein
MSGCTAISPSRSLLVPPGDARCKWWGIPQILRANPAIRPIWPTPRVSLLGTQSGAFRSGLLLDPESSNESLWTKPSYGRIAAVRHKTTSAKQGKSQRRRWICCIRFIQNPLSLMVNAKGHVYPALEKLLGQGTACGLDGFCIVRGTTGLAVLSVHQRFP